MQIGVMGGTFDPPHIAHLVVAVQVRAARALDRLLLVPAGDPWQKSGRRAITPAHLRVEMVRAAAADLDGIEVSDIETRRHGPSFTIDTLDELLAQSPSAQPCGLELVLGADAVAGLPTWHRATELPQRCDLVVVDRPGTSGDPPAWWPSTHVHHVETPLLEVSSTDIRDRVHRGLTVEVLVPPPVRRIIDEHRLYL